MTLPWDEYAADLGYDSEREMLLDRKQHIRETAKEMGVEPVTLKYRYKLAGIPLPRRKTIKEQLLAIPDKERRTLAAPELAKMFGVDSASVYLRCKRDNIKIRKVVKNGR